MARNLGRWRWTRINSHRHPSKVRISPNQTLSPRRLLTSHLQPSPWKMQPWPNALPLRPRQRSISARMKKRRMRKKQHGHSVLFCLSSLRHGFHITSWCWSTLSVRTASLGLFGHWATGCVMWTAQSTPCVMPSVTRLSVQHLGIFWCASGIKGKTSLIFNKRMLLLSGRKTQCKVHWQIIIWICIWIISRAAKQHTASSFREKMLNWILLNQTCTGLTESFVKLAEGSRAGLLGLGLSMILYLDSCWSNLKRILMILRGSF